MRPDLRKIWPTLLLCTVLLSVGGIAGFVLRPIIVPPIAQLPVDDEPLEPDGHGDTSIVEVNEIAMKNMKLKFGKFEVRDYSNRIRIPAEVVERIPQSRRSVATPTAGRISKVFIAEGQAVRPNEKLFELQLTDQSLASSQAQLLSVLSEIEINRKELDRLTGLFDQGVVARKRLIGIDFEIKKLVNKRDALKQELKMRGMDESTVANLIETKQLSRSLIVYAPSLEPESSTDNDQTVRSNVNAAFPDSINSVSIGQASFDESLVGETLSSESTSGELKDEQYFTVESIAAFEGSTLELGQPLCELTHHSSLLIKGYAYEIDIEKIAMSKESGDKFTARFGEDHLQRQDVREGLSLFQIDNHVDTNSQTYPFFVELGNEILSRTTDKQNRTYVNWRFKPGQRAHLEFPIETWKEQVVIPLTALVREGAETFVFLKIGHTHEGPDGTIHEFKKISVEVRHTDQQFAVLTPSIALDTYEEYALDQAYKLNQTLKLAADGGADPHAGHSHD
ncbi:MAG: efflux RND transporter periplasmic adaptor subunit [Mariniblastus sp.]